MSPARALAERPSGGVGGRRGRVPAALVAAAAIAAVSACAGAPVPAAVGSTSPSSPPAPTPGSTPAPSGSTSVSPPAIAPPAERSITLVAGGDVLLHEPTWAQADADAGVVGDGVLDFTATLAGIEPVVSAADLALCHLEIPLAPAGGPYAGYPTFSVPPQIAGALAATGFDACSFASNHTFDQGLDGAYRTVTQMRTGGVPTYGVGDGAEPPNPSFVMVGDVKIGLLAYTYGSNTAVPQDGVVEMLDVQDIVADARVARQAGAEIVVASVHWGTEYDHEPNAQQRDLAAQLASSPDVDLVVGHHAHVVQPITRVGGTWVAYGLGNMVAAQATPVPANHEGVLARFSFTRRDGAWVVTEAAYVPTFIERAPAVRVLALGGPMAATPRQLEALARTRSVVRGGSGSAGLVEIIPPP